MISMAPIIAERITSTWTQRGLRVLSIVWKWLAKQAASALWTLWHKTGFDHLCQLLLRTVKTMAIGVGIAFCTPWLIYLTVKMVIWAIRSRWKLRDYLTGVREYARQDTGFGRMRPPGDTTPDIRSPGSSAGPSYSTEACIFGCTSLTGT